MCVLCVLQSGNSVKNNNILLHFFSARSKTPGRALPKLSIRGAGQKTPGRKTPTTPFNQQDRWLPFSELYKVEKECLNTKMEIQVDISK